MAEPINISTSALNHYSGSYSRVGGTNRIIVRRGLNQLYYSNFNTGSGLVVETGSYDQFKNNNFDNFLESSFAVSGSRILTGRGAIYSIPRELFGTHIEPGSIIISSSYSKLVDDKEGNLRLDTVTGAVKGNVIYSHGQLIITDFDTANFYESGSDGSDPDNAPGAAIITFKSNQPIYTYNYNVNISDYEYNFTTNPSAQTGSTVLTYSGSKYQRPSGVLADNVTGSNFQPYITTVGLYNDYQELIAVAKLAQPLPKPANTELTIQVRLDI